MRLDPKSLSSLGAGLLVLLGVPLAWGQTLPPLAKQLNPAETAILLVDFQNNFAAPDGEHYPRDRKSTRLNSSHIQKSRMPSSA